MEAGVATLDWGCHPKVAAPGVGFIWFENEISKSWLCLEPMVVVLESKLNQLRAEGRCSRLSLKQKVPGSAPKVIAFDPNSIGLGPIVVLLSIEFRQGWLVSIEFQSRSTYHRLHNHSVWKQESLLTIEFETCCGREGNSRLDS